MSVKAYVICGGAGVDGWERPDDADLVIACHDHAYRIAQAPDYQVSPDWVYWRDHEPREGAAGVWFDAGDAPPGWHSGPHVWREPSARLWARYWSPDVAMIGGCSGIPAMWLAWQLDADEVEFVGLSDPGASLGCFRYAIQHAEAQGLRVYGLPSCLRLA